MTSSWNDLLENVAWQALGTEHVGLAISSPLARRYPADVVPLAALKENRAEALAELRELLELGEPLYVAWDDEARGEFPHCTGIEILSHLLAWRMAYPVSENGSGAPQDDVTPSIERLTAVDASDMVGLTDVAFPGFFRPRTYLMGHYSGIRVEGKLIAMAGERLALPGIREISAVCTHPDHTGQGHAARLIRHVLRAHSAAGLRSFLHVGEPNHRAIALYDRLGFVKVGATRFTRIRRA